MTDQPSPDELESALRVLRWAAQDVARLDGHLEWQSLVAKINRQARRRQRRDARDEQQAHDAGIKARALQSRVAATRTVQTDSSRDATVNAEPLLLKRARRCYTCKTPYWELHAVYHLLCPACAAFNLEKRTQRGDLRGRVALVTGGRVKIGFELALKLLRDGAHVVVTTRFPNDALERFRSQPDFARWSNRLELHGLDLRHLGDVRDFARRLNDTLPHLDILVNNAAQTISRPTAFYAHLLEGERRDPVAALASSVVRSRMRFYAATNELALEDEHFPPGAFDADGQALDARPYNSWSQTLHEVPVRDLLEVHLVNFLAPFTLCSALKPSLLRSPFPRRFVVNVSAMEGQFTRASKGVRHPHTNAAKAALNMLTRTSGADYARDGIYMTAVDTGWITDENPLPKASRLRANGFVTPLDHVDGAARVYDPIVTGIGEDEEPAYGVFLKDYRPYPW
jgi:NAD(P)-dependent dehydrogenase (short-subunit alcohol dehydrogenase family)